MVAVGSFFRKIFWYISDTWEMVKRNLLHVLRDLGQISAVLVMPVIYTVLFRYLFGGAIGSAVSIPYVDYLIPGMLVMNILFISLVVCVSISTDLKKGIINRFKSLPINQSAVINGHIIAGLVRAIFVLGIVVALGIAMGFRATSDVSAWLSAFGILVLVALATSSFLMSIGLVAKTVEAAQQFGSIAILSLAMMSSALIPPITLPDILRTLVENQPYTRAMEAMRALLVEMPADSHVQATLLWFGGIMVVTCMLNYYLFSRAK